MKVLLSILFNALILYLLAYLMWWNWWNLSDWISVEGWYQTYIIWGIILWLMNITIRPILKILAIPLFFVFLWLVSFIINWVIFWLFNTIINDILLMDWVSYKIMWKWLEYWTNFIIVVAIFTILNMLYSLLIFKK